MGRTRRGDRRDTLICHGDRRFPEPVALLAAAVGFSTGLAVLVTAISLPPLLTPDRHTAGRATGALPTVATDADRKYGSAVRVAAQLLTEDGSAVNGQVGHSGIMPSPGTEVKLFCRTMALMIGRMICAFGADDVAGLGVAFRKLRFPMIDDSIPRISITFHGAGSSSAHTRLNN